jgi:ribose 1,5-bisphosphokinase PhnN
MDTDPMDNTEVRRWYLRQVGTIGEKNEAWLAEGVSAEVRATRAWEMRSRFRAQAREMMQNQAEIDLLRQRDRLKYGREDGPTLEWVLRRVSAEGYSSDEAYEMVIAMACSTNREVSERLGAS